jgi:hypothetical protein
LRFLLSEVYLVCDGHHRISVAQALGQAAIDAEVTVCQMKGPLPWQAAGSPGDRWPPLIRL